MINPQWLELPMSQTIFCGPKDFEPLKFDCRYLICAAMIFCLGGFSIVLLNSIETGQVVLVVKNLPSCHCWHIGYCFITTNLIIIIIIIFVVVFNALHAG